MARKGLFGLLGDLVDVAVDLDVKVDPAPTVVVVDDEPEDPLETLIFGHRRRRVRVVHSRDAEGYIVNRLREIDERLEEIGNFVVLDWDKKEKAGLEAEKAELLKKL
jgi:hypothetical protein